MIRTENSDHIKEKVLKYKRFLLVIVASVSKVKKLPTVKGMQINDAIASPCWEQDHSLCFDVGC